MRFTRWIATAAASIATVAGVWAAGPTPIANLQLTTDADGGAHRFTNLQEIVAITSRTVVLVFEGGTNYQLTAPIVGSMTGENTNSLLPLYSAIPTNGNQVANKGYVDGLVGGVSGTSAYAHAAGTSIYAHAAGTSSYANAAGTSATADAATYATVSGIASNADQLGGVGAAFFVTNSQSNVGLGSNVTSGGNRLLTNEVDALFACWKNAFATVGTYTWPIKYVSKNGQPFTGKIIKLAGTNVWLLGGSGGYVNSTAFIYRSTNSCRTWSSTNQCGSSQSVQDLCDMGGGIVLASTSGLRPADGGDIYRSTNSGLTWARVAISLDPAPGNYEYITQLARMGSRVLAGTYPKARIFTSDDNGTTWSNRVGFYPGQFTYLIIPAILPMNTSTVLVSVGINGDIFRSTDAGTTWASNTPYGSLPVVKYPAVGMAQSLAKLSDGTLLAGSYPDCSVYRSTDGGANWSLAQQLATNVGYVYTMDVDSNNNVYAGMYGIGEAALWRSVSNGLCWNKWGSLPGSDGLSDITVTDSNTLFIAANSIGAVWVANRSWMTYSFQTTTNTQHSELLGLDYANSGHTGFQPTGDYPTQSQVSVNFGTNLTVSGNAVLTNEALWIVASNNVAYLNKSNTYGAGTIQNFALATVTNNASALTEVVNWRTMTSHIARGISYSIVPAASNVYDLGSALMPFRSGYFDTNSVYLGDYGISKAKAIEWDAKVGTNDPKYMYATTNGQSAVLSGLILTNAGNLVGTRLKDEFNNYTSTAGESARFWTDVASSADGTKLAACAVDDRIYTSTDAGTNWTARGPVGNWYGIASSADGTRLAVCGVGNQIHVSSDAGTNWTMLAFVALQWYDITCSADGMQLVACAFNDQIYISTDFGNSWTPRDEIRNWYSVASSADGTKLVAGSLDYIYTSTDAGTNWIARDEIRNWYGIASSADGTRLIAGVDGGQIYTSTDAGTNWIARDSSRMWRSVASSANGTRLIAGAYNNYLYTSDDAGTNWTAIESSRNWRGVASSADGTKLVACDEGDMGVNLGLIYTIEMDYIDGTASSILGFGNIIPAASNTFDLGSLDTPYRDLYLGSNSLYMYGMKVLRYDPDTTSLVSDVQMTFSVNGTNIDYATTNWVMSRGFLASIPSYYVTNSQSGVNFASLTVAGNAVLTNAPIQSGTNYYANKSGTSYYANVSAVSTYASVAATASNGVYGFNVNGNDAVAMTIDSGASNLWTAFGIKQGGAVMYHGPSVSGAAGQWVSDAVAGDIVYRMADVNKHIRFGIGSAGAAEFVISNDSVRVAGALKVNGTNVLIVGDAGIGNVRTNLSNTYDAGTSQNFALATVTSNAASGTDVVNYRSMTNYMAGFIGGSGHILMTEFGQTSVLYHVTSGNHTNKIGEFFTSP